MTTAILRTGLAVLLAGFAYGQSADKSLNFEAASVKPAAPLVPDGRGRIIMMGPSGGPGTKDPGRIRYPGMNLRFLIMTAYDVKGYQVTGPAWLDSERFDITATMPAETTKEQFRTMLQNLLAERFKLTVHHQTKELPTYTLSVNKGGPKLTESAPPAPPKETDGEPALPALPNGPPKMGPDGFPILPSLLGGRGGVFMMMMPGRARLMAQQATMKDLADRLTQQLSKPVTDATQLTGKYDFTLTFSPEGLSGPMGPMGPPSGLPAGGAMVAVRDEGHGGGGDSGKGPGGNPSDAEAPPDLFHAIQAQLGLRLDSKKGQVETIVVDHVEKTPTEN